MQGQQFFSKLGIIGRSKRANGRFPNCIPLGGTEQSEKFQASGQYKHADGGQAIGVGQFSIK